MSTTTETRVQTTNLYSDELTCPSCIAKIERRLAKVDGVETSTVHFGSGRIEVRHDPTVATVDDLVEAVRRAGYAAAPRAFR